MKLRYLIPGVLCLILCVVFVYLMLPKKSDPVIVGGPSFDTTEALQTASGTEKPEDTTGVSAGDTEAETTGLVDDTTADSETEYIPPDTQYVSPVDFPTIQKRCADIYGWLLIPNTNISYPVVQHPTDDSYYLRRDIDGKKSNGGTLFTEHSYNGNNFDDRVTVIYGHHLRSGEMFGHLQEYYADDDTFKSCSEMIIYCPDRELHYKVFAAVPFTKEHIMYKYRRFRSEGTLEKFLDKVYSTRGFETSFDKSVTVTDDDKVLVLSTCLDGNNQKRYLVLAKLVKIVD